MNPSGNETHGLSLPPPAGEQFQQVPSLVPNQAPHAPELNQLPVERGGGLGQPPAMVAPPLNLTIPAPVMPTPVPTQATDTGSNQSNTTTDDGDLIEKEWVNKAKAIVERTRDNPYKQSEELTVVKADYMKQRYNKTIKLSK